MHKEVKKKLKVFAVDAAMVFLAVQLSTVIREDQNKAVCSSAQVSMDMSKVDTDKLSFFVPTDSTNHQAGDNENQRSDTTSQGTGQERKTLIRGLDWGYEDSQVLLKIAAAEADGETVEGMALVMLVVLNRVWTDGFPDSVEEVVLEDGQFSSTDDDGKYWDAEPSIECKYALQMVKDGWDESQGALYFTANGEECWMSDQAEYLFSEGCHSFYR